MSTDIDTTRILDLRLLFKLPYWNNILSDINLLNILKWETLSKQEPSLSFQIWENLNDSCNCIAFSGIFKHQFVWTWW